MQLRARAKLEKICFTISGIGLGNGDGLRLLVELQMYFKNGSGIDAEG